MGRIRREQGGGHVMVIVALVVILGAGGAGWWVWKQHAGPSDPAIKAAFKSLDCKGVSDKDLCKFYAASKVAKYTSVNSTVTSGSGTLTSSYEQQSSGTYHAKSSGLLSYELINIGTAQYVKDPTKNVWWKQTINAGDENKYAPDPSLTNSYATSPTDNSTVFTKQGIEACGTLKCFKYKAVDKQNGDSGYIWFDTTNYRLQKVQSSTKDGSVTATLGYNSVHISTPSPVQTLGANQYIVPGQSTPVTIPSSSSTDLSTTDTQALQQQLQTLEQQYQQYQQ